MLIDHKKGRKVAQWKLKLSVLSCWHKFIHKFIKTKVWKITQAYIVFILVCHTYNILFLFPSSWTCCFCYLLLLLFLGFALFLFICFDFFFLFVIITVYYWFWKHERKLFHNSIMGILDPPGREWSLNHWNSTPRLVMRVDPYT